jgi:hypothetical protein
MNVHVAAQTDYCLKSNDNRAAISEAYILLIKIKSCCPMIIRNREPNPSRVLAAAVAAAPFESS